MIEHLQIKRCLISVYDKTDLTRLVKALKKHNVEIFASGGTYNFLTEQFDGIKSLSEITGLVSLLNGRVKTLHPLVHASILARKDLKEHLDELKAIGIEPFDLVVVNFYPFEKVIASTQTSEEEIIENIDIGGPALVRSAAKNFQSIVVLTSINQYDSFIDELETNNGSISFELRKKLASEAFQMVAEYDVAISNYFNKDNKLNISLPLEKELRYGENPHQSAKVYGAFSEYFQQIHGKELSYNNILDIVAVTDLVMEFDKTACAIVKHNSPCGVAIGDSTAEVFEKARACDPISVFGGIVAFNTKFNSLTAEKLNEIFIEVIVAPDYDEDVLEILRKKKDRRLIKFNPNYFKNSEFLFANELRSIPGGLIIQSKDKINIEENDLEFVTDLRPNSNELEDLKFAFIVAKYVKSNAIVFAKNGMTIGIGGGQTSRVYSVMIAIMKANEFKHDLNDSVVASDGFFPFPDSVEIAAEAGAKAFIQPGGSIRDNEVIYLANQKKLKMVLTKIRHFKH